MADDDFNPDTDAPRTAGEFTDIVARRGQYTFNVKGEWWTARLLDIGHVDASTEGGDR